MFILYREVDVEVQAHTEEPVTAPPSRPRGWTLGYGSQAIRLPCPLGSLQAFTQQTTMNISTSIGAILISIITTFDFGAGGVA